MHGRWGELLVRLHSLHPLKRDNLSINFDIHAPVIIIRMGHVLWSMAFASGLMQQAVRNEKHVSSL